MALNPSICLVLFLQLLLSGALEHRPLQPPTSRRPHRTDIAEVPIPARWDVIGPFPYSSRELGADSLEAFGGILGIPRGDNATYPSELASTWGTYTGGRVGWKEVNTSTDNTTVKVDLVTCDGTFSKRQSAPACKWPGAGLWATFGSTHRPRTC